MGNLSIRDSIPAMSDAEIQNVCNLEDIALDLEQVSIDTEHTIHGGMYARTIRIPAGTVLTGALIKIATLLIVFGDVDVYIGASVRRFKGYNVIPASQNRKQAFYAIADTYLTMVFPTKAKNVKDAEQEFTDEYHLLLSHLDDKINKVIVTGE